MLEYKSDGNDIKVMGLNDFNLDETFECGQCFRWNKESDGGYVGVAAGRILHILSQDDCIILKNTSLSEFEEFWKNYFDLDLDYTCIKSELSNLHPNLKLACNYAPGIKILHQDSWEALCSFIISQNNNIPRIKGIVERLCENFGHAVGDKMFSFPNPNVIAKLDEEDLKPIRSGFRAKYILDAARKIVNGDIIFKDISKMPLNEARDTLMQIKGVGPKVAECTLLYGFYRTDAFPIDTWMKKAMAIMFPGCKAKDFGLYAGIAQQYIFHYSRMNPQVFKQAE